MRSPHAPAFLCEVFPLQTWLLLAGENAGTIAAGFAQYAPWPAAPRKTNQSTFVWTGTHGDAKKVLATLLEHAPNAPHHHDIALDFATRLWGQAKAYGPHRAMRDQRPGLNVTTFLNGHTPRTSQWALGGAQTGNHYADVSPLRFRQYVQGHNFWLPEHLGLFVLARTRHIPVTGTLVLHDTDTQQKFDVSAVSNHRFLETLHRAPSPYHIQSSGHAWRTLLGCPSTP